MTDFMRLTTLVNVLFTTISLHTGLKFWAYISGIEQLTGLFFFSSTKETVFSHPVSLPQCIASFVDLLL